MPRLSDCETCGASASLEWITPIFDHSPGAEPGSVDALQVKIVCPTCGPLVQIVRDDDLPSKREGKGPLEVPQLRSEDKLGVVLRAGEQKLG